MKISRTAWLPWAILLIVLGLTWQIWNHERENAQLQLKTHFDFSLRETSSRIEQRMGTYEQLLRGVQAQYAAMGSIDRKGLQDYVATLQLDAHFSGIQAIGQIDWVPAAQLQTHLAKMRQLGFNDYRIFPEGRREAYAPIVQREPYIGLNRAALGLDSWAEPTRHLAMLRARDSGMASVSGKVRLAVETDPVEQPGFVMYLPIYANSQPGDSPEERSAKHIGWVFASFRMKDLMANLYGQLPPGIHFAIHDGIELTDQTLLYQSDQQAVPSPSVLNVNEYLVIGGRTWTLSMVATHDFAEQFGRNAAPLIAWSGIALALLLTLIAWLLTTSRARALSLAQTMTVELQASERFMHTVTDNIPGLVAYWNADLRCEFANAHLQDYFGKTPAEMQGIPIRALFGEAMYRQEEPRIHAVLRGEVQNFEQTLTRPDGSTRYNYAQYIPDCQGGQVKGFYVLVSDITPLKQVEAALLSSEQYARTAIDAMPEHICVIDNEGTIVAVNQAWRDFYARNSPDPLADNFGVELNYLGICHAACGPSAEEALAMAQGIRAVMNGECPLFELEYPCDSPSEKRIFKARVTRFYGESGNVLICHENITQPKLIEAELANHRNRLELLVQQRTAALSIAKEAAEAANRAKTIFLANMSHELRTPMNAIMGFTGIVRQKLTDPKQIDQLGKVLAASNQLLAIINDILELSRVEAEYVALAPSRFKLGDILARLDATFKSEAQQKDLSLDLDIDSALAARPLWGDPVRLEQILFKLTSNAIKFTAAGSIKVRVSLSKESVTNLFLRFEVADTGIGIPTEDQGRLFSAFEQLDGSMTRKYGGTGLGLAISKRLVLAMDGNIGVESKFGAGSTFWFTVRLGKEALEASA